MSLRALKQGIITIFDDAGIKVRQSFDETFDIELNGVVVLQVNDLKKIHNDLNDYEIDMTITCMTLKDEDLDNSKIDTLISEVNAVASGLTASVLKYQSGEKVIGIVHNGETLKQDEGANVFEIAKTIYVCDLEI